MVASHYFKVDRVADEDSAVNRSFLCDQSGKVYVSIHMVQPLGETDGIYHLQNETARQGERFAMIHGYENAKRHALIFAGFNPASETH